jgi:hypothetical protein
VWRCRNNFPPLSLDRPRWNLEKYDAKMGVNSWAMPPRHLLQFITQGVSIIPCSVCFWKSTLIDIHSSGNLFHITHPFMIRNPKDVERNQEGRDRYLGFPPPVWFSYQIFNLFSGFASILTRRSNMQNAWRHTAGSEAMDGSFLSQAGLKSILL